MPKAKNRRPQTPKPAAGRNQPYMAAMQELRRSSAAQPHKSADTYQRRPKHMGQGWE